MFARVCVREGGRLWITKARAMLVPASREVSDLQKPPQKREKRLSPSPCLFLSLYVTVVAPPV